MFSSLWAIKARTAPPVSVFSCMTCSSVCMAAKRRLLHSSLCLTFTPARPASWVNPTGSSGRSAWNRCAGELSYEPTVQRVYAPYVESALMLKHMSVRTRTVHRQTRGCWFFSVLDVIHYFKKYIFTGFFFVLFFCWKTFGTTCNEQTDWNYFICNLHYHHSLF